MAWYSIVSMVLFVILLPGVPWLAAC